MKLWPKILLFPLVLQFVKDDFKTKYYLEPLGNFIKVGYLIALMQGSLCGIEFKNMDWGAMTWIRIMLQHEELENSPFELNIVRS